MTAQRINAVIAVLAAAVAGVLGAWASLTIGKIAVVVLTVGLLTYVAAGFIGGVAAGMREAGRARRGR